MRSCFQILVRCVRSDFQVLLHRGRIGAVRGLRVPNKSTVSKRPPERTESFDSVKLTVYTRDT